MRASSASAAGLNTLCPSFSKLQCLSPPQDHIYLLIEMSFSGRKHSGSLVANTPHLLRSSTKSVCLPPDQHMHVLSVPRNTLSAPSALTHPQHKSVRPSHSPSSQKRIQRSKEVKLFALGSNRDKRQTQEHGSMSAFLLPTLYPQGSVLVCLSSQLYRLLGDEGHSSFCFSSLVIS